MLGAAALPRCPEPGGPGRTDEAGSVGGRPHWGKLHTQSAETLRDAYPRFDDFLRVRDELDPERRFANAYLDRVLGGPATT